MDNLYSGSRLKPGSLSLDSQEFSRLLKPRDFSYGFEPLLVTAHLAGDLFDASNRADLDESARYRFADDRQVVFVDEVRMTNTSEAGTPPKTKQGSTPTPRASWWTPRIWLGFPAGGLLRLLAKNRFRIGWRQLHIAVTDVSASFINSALGLLQRAIYGRRIEATELEDPIIIVGHWRTGTTFLHELLILDPRHSFASTYQCLAPTHFLISEWLFTRIFGLFIPSHRPMDNMPLGFERPQEDEFGLCNLGLPSPYLTLAFPNEPPPYEEYYDLEQVPPADRKRWQQGFVRFLKAITLRKPGRLVLKSPPHTCRVKWLLELFPNARFVHLVRDPYVVFPSTVHLWRSLYTTEGLQTPKFEGLEDRVFDRFVKMDERWEETRGRIDPSRLVSLKYEELVADPLGQLENIYEQFGLGGFEEARPKIEKHLSSVKDYKTNRYQLTAELEAEITRRWGPIIEKYGYQRDPVGA